jgi:hypothetical protein
MACLLLQGSVRLGKKERIITGAVNKTGGKKRMKAMQKIKVVLALAVVLATSNVGWAAKSRGVGIPGDLDGTRTEVTVEVTVPQMEAPPTGLCDTANAGQTYSIKTYIFQPSGRIFAMGIGANTETFSCSTTADQQIDMFIKALQGLSFKPGPATLVYHVIQTTTDTTDPLNPKMTDLVVHESGFRIDLH